VAEGVRRASPDEGRQALARRQGGVIPPEGLCGATAGAIGSGLREVPRTILPRTRANREARGLGFPRFHVKRRAPQRPHRPLAVGAHRAALAASQAPRLPAVSQGHDLDGKGVLASPRLRSIPHLRSISGPHRVPPLPTCGDRPRSRTCRRPSSGARSCPPRWPVRRAEPPARRCLPPGGYRG
jgi:hypothetical protein